MAGSLKKAGPAAALQTVSPFCRSRCCAIFKTVRVCNCLDFIPKNKRTIQIQLVRMTIASVLNSDGWLIFLQIL